MLAEDIDVGSVTNPKIGMDRYGRAVSVWVQTVGERTDIWSSRLE